MSTELKPCPFCGRPVNHEYCKGDSFDTDILKVWCGAEFNTFDTCGGYMQFDCGSEEDLISQYNKRPSQPCLCDMLKESLGKEGD